MLSFLPGTVRGIITVILVIINLFFWLLFLLPFALVKLLIPATTVRKPINAVLNFICTRWASCNKLILKLVNNIYWDDSS